METEKILDATNQVFNFDKLVNTQYFREPALFYEKYGCYTDAPYNSPDYIEYWDEQERRCLNGYKVGDLWIPGRYYFYLNFIPIIRTLTEEERNKNPHLTEIYSFPRFWELDYSWFLAKDLAAKAGKHIACLKTRRGGFSYKEAADGIYNYNFIPDSKSFYFAATEDYLIKDGIFNKVHNNLEWLNAQTDWYKNRQAINKSFHKKASYYDQDKIERGFKSELIAQVLDSPDKARGKAGIKITFEEGGSFKNLLHAWEICMPQVKQGHVVKGQMTAFGTGGNDKDEGLEGLSTLFNNPEAYDVFPFYNIWDEDLEGTTCGFFVPATMIRENHMDKDGNIDKKGATKDILAEREIRKKANDPVALQRMCAENPLNPSEALSRVSNNIFNVEECKAQLRYIESGKTVNMLSNGYLSRDKEGNLKFILDPKASPLLDYPIKKYDTKEKRSNNLKGCLSVVQHPYKEESKVPKDLYLVCVDPYAQDDSEYSDSVGSVYVIKRDVPGIPRDNLNDNIVAFYNGRPNSLNEFWRIVFDIAEYYNCKVQSEILGGGTTGIVYARHNKKLHLCHYEPDITSNKNGKKSGSYFMKVNADTKSSGLTYLAEHIMKEVAVDSNDIDDDGNITKYKLNVHSIYDPGLLKEFIKYNDEGNFDRVSALIVGMYMLKEYHNKKIKTNKKRSSFWNRMLTGIDYE